MSRECLEEGQSGAEAEAAGPPVAGQAGLLSKVLTVHGSWPGPVTPQPPDSDPLNEALGVQRGRVDSQGQGPQQISQLKVCSSGSEADLELSGALSPTHLTPPPPQCPFHSGMQHPGLWADCGWVSG